jgi:type I restriction enzyme M protein
MSERITENLFEKLLEKYDYINNNNNINVEYQKSKIADIDRLLSYSSKNNKNNKGYPDFIITSKKVPDFVIIVECKLSINKHKSSTLKEIKDYAVDGALHYAKNLSKNYNVLAIGFSGENTTEYNINMYLQAKGGSEAQEFKNKDNKIVSEILKNGEFLTFDDIVEIASFDRAIYNSRHKDLIEFATDLHNFMRDYAQLAEQEKPLLVSGTLIALYNDAFNTSFDKHSPEDLQKEWLSVIKKEIEKAEIPQAKKNNMIQPYTSISVHPELGKATKKYPKGILYELVEQLNTHVFPYIKYMIDYDVVGNFYGEFLKYTGGDKKNLGIVLTPKHITELFSDIAEVKKDSVVLDPCAGTAGFLVSAMHKMLSCAVTLSDKENIKKNNLIGIESNPNMFALAASNMILRGDGKANLYQASCFDGPTKEKIKTHKCTVGMINPPYSQKAESLHELDFVFNMLELLEKSAIGIAIIPMSCVIQKNKLKAKLLKYHTLEAVMSMPTDLFYPVGTVTCIAVFKAHIPHKNTNKETWFGYWKDDGYKLFKHRGRVNINGEEVKEKWLYNYRNKKEIAGQSVMQNVTAEDEWCAEAYMETDYSQLKEEDFIQTLKKFTIFLFEQNYINSLTTEKFYQNKKTYINTQEWGDFKYKDIFNINRGKDVIINCEKISNLINRNIYSLISSSDNNNGVSICTQEGKKLFNGNNITIANNGSVGACFYQIKPFFATSDVSILENDKLNKYNALFIVSIIIKEKYRFNYGRKWGLEKMQNHKIKLPITKEGNPDWQFMEDYIKSLPYSKNL